VRRAMQGEALEKTGEVANSNSRAALRA
jgi:hypothetical protein